MKKDKNKDRIKEQIVTYEIYAAMPDDGQRYEIVDGAMEMMTPGASMVHQTISRELSFKLLQSCNEDYSIYYAPFDVILSETNVLQPDIMMIHFSRMHIVTSRGVEGPPDLVVEIISPSSRRRDKIVKMKVYSKHNVPEYWIVDSDLRILEQYRLSGETYELHNLFEGNQIVSSDKLPCVSFAIRDLFKGLL